MHSFIWWKALPWTTGHKYEQSPSFFIPLLEGDYLCWDPVIDTLRQSVIILNEKINPSAYKCDGDKHVHPVLIILLGLGARAKSRFVPGGSLFKPLEWSWWFFRMRFCTIVLWDSIHRLALVFVTNEGGQYIWKLRMVSLYFYSNLCSMD